mmetsp:Transcript_49911/g.138641  ORF Transcript_49911/g.138641 Transcript_49911/m.138641 type:complete len:127 (-) Transcript_49911:807-1187(-)
MPTTCFMRQHHASRPDMNPSNLRSLNRFVRCVLGLLVDNRANYNLAVVLRLLCILCALHFVGRPPNQHRRDEKQSEHHMRDTVRVDEVHAPIRRLDRNAGVGQVRNESSKGPDSRERHDDRRLRHQ